MNSELLKILFAVGMGQSVVLAVILLLPRGESRLARIALAVLLGVMGLMLWDAYVGLLGPEFAAWSPAILYLSSLWLIGPALWLYVRGLTRGPVRRAWLHALPAVTLLALYLGLALVGWRLPDGARLALLLALYAQVTVYILLAVVELLRHRRRITANLSDLTGQSLAWLQVLVGFFLAVWLLDGYIVITDTLTHRASPFAYQLLMLGESAWVILAAFIALRQPDILHRQLVAEPARKYRNSPLSENASRELSVALETLMTEEKPHLDNGLTLPQLARRLGVSPHVLSQLLNDALGCNFYEFVNRARVNEAQRLLQDAHYGEMAILDIAFQSGFNNKNSFNKAFRRFTSLTPSEYRRATMN